MDNNEIERHLSQEQFQQYKKLVKRIKTLHKKGETSKATQKEKELIIFKQQTGIFEIEIDRKVKSIQLSRLR